MNYIIYFNKMYNLDTEILAIRISGVQNPDQMIDKYKELYRLLYLYKDTHSYYLKNRLGKEKSYYWSELFSAITKVISYMNENRDIFYPMRSFNAFKCIDLILTDWKQSINEPDVILFFRKTINWIRKKY